MLNRLVRPQWTYKIKRQTNGILLHKTCVQLSMCFVWPVDSIDDSRHEIEVSRVIAYQPTLGL